MPEARLKGCEKRTVGVLRSFGERGEAATAFSESTTALTTVTPWGSTRQIALGRVLLKK